MTHFNHRDSSTGGHLIGSVSYLGFADSFLLDLLLLNIAGLKLTNNQDRNQYIKNTAAQFNEEHKSNRFYSLLV